MLRELAEESRLDQSNPKICKELLVDTLHPRGWKHLLKIQGITNAIDARLPAQFCKKAAHSEKTYRIWQNLSCDSDWLIYLCTCKKCGGQCVGKSKTKFKVRHSNHKQEVKNQIGGLGHHYGGQTGCGYQNFSVILIERVQHQNLDFLAEREVFWQNQLRVYPENGAKGHCYRKEKIGR